MKTINETNYVKVAESVIKKLSSKKDKRGRSVPMVTTSKLRNLLAMTADIYNEVEKKQEEKLTPEVVSKIQYLKLRFVYEAGREQKVKDLINEAKLLDVLDEIGGSRKNYILFSHYMEALVAYHRFYGGKE